MDTYRSKVPLTEKNTTTKTKTKQEKPKPVSRTNSAEFDDEEQLLLDDDGELLNEDDYERYIIKGTQKMSRSKSKSRDIGASGEEFSINESK